MQNLEKIIKEQQQQTLVETADRLKKIEELVRMGLMPVENLPLLKRAFTSMEQNAFMPHAHRKIFYDFIGELMDLTLNDSTINRLLKQRVMSTKHEEVELVSEAGIELSKAPEGMLITFANIVKSKKRAGGKPTEGDKILASRAKNELRRRRNIMKKRMQEEAGSEYKEKMQKAMKKFGITTLKDLPVDKKKEFFNYLDSIHVAKHEK